jgi:hypothetical protein
MQGDRPFVHMRRAIVTALAILLGMLVGALIAATILRAVPVLSHAVVASHGAAAARLLFGFTLDPLAGYTTVYPNLSATYRPRYTPVHSYAPIFFSSVPNILAP